MRRSNPCTSSAVKALSSESIGTWCTTSPKAALGVPDTRCVGESGVISSGCCASSARNSCISRSYSASGICGSSST